MRYKMVVVLVSLSLVGAALLAACSTGSETNAPTFVPTAVPTAQPAAATPVLQQALAQADVDAIRQVVFAYWDAMNAYDPDKVFTYMTDSWRQQDGQTVIDEINRLKNGVLFIKNIHLGVEEKSAPVAIGDGQAEMFITLKTPTGNQTVYDRLVKVGDQWKVDFSEER